jgi:uncharacterized iron-regulated membrane protein
LWATLRWVHRWLGLTLGLVFTAVALSGSLLLFQPQFFEWVHGEMIPDNLAQKPGSVDAWVANGRTAVPELGDPIAIWRPHVSHNISDAAMLIYAGLEPGGLGNMGFAGVLIAPATGAVLGVFNVDRSPAYAPLFFHRDLWAGEIGRVLSGVMAIGTLFLLSMGLYLWWPPRKRLLHKLSPRPLRATFSSAVRLHNWTGIWMLVALLVLTASGLYLVRPGWVEPALTILPERHEEQANSEGACGAPMGFDAALARAQDIVPNGIWTALYPHDEAFRSWEIAMRIGGDTDAEHGDVRVLADLQCGTVILHETAGSRSPRDTAKVWLTGIHDGTPFGMSGEIVVTLLGLVPLVLAWTGIRMWLRRSAR